MCENRNKDIAVHFSRSYNCTVGLASSCLPSVRPSVSLSVHGGSHGRCTKLYQRAPCSRHVPICSFRHFCSFAVGSSHSKKQTRTCMDFLRLRQPRVHWFIAHDLGYCWERVKIDIANFARHAWVDFVWVRSLNSRPARKIGLPIPVVRRPICYQRQDFLLYMNVSASRHY